MRINKTNKLANGNQLFAFWANNKGRGHNNCTLQVVAAGTERPAYSRDTENVIATTKTGSWAGDVNLSQIVCDKLGIKKTDIIG